MNSLKYSVIHLKRFSTKPIYRELLKFHKFLDRASSFRFCIKYFPILYTYIIFIFGSSSQEMGSVLHKSKISDSDFATCVHCTRSLSYTYPYTIYIYTLSGI